MPQSAPPKEVRGFRKDIQGLRAIAVALVVLYHLWPNRLSGGFVGVDVFFVISGFLITSHLLLNPPAQGRALLDFWGRRIRRLLPASLLVLAATAVATRLVAPSTRWEDIANQIIMSALYVENWALANTSTDYLAAEAAATPVQHFWSLSVEEQFYLLWPILIFLCVWWAARRRLRMYTAVRVMIVGVILVSFAFSIWATANEPARAYFVTPTRMWELALGGLAATLIWRTRFPFSDYSRAATAWTGLLCILVSGIWYSGSTPFPGYTAALPVVGTVLVIFAAARTAYSPTGILSFRPIQWLGDVSYSVYLWHWPMIVLLPYLSGGELGILDKLVILVVTLLAAAWTKIHVEDRFRIVRSRNPLLSTYRMAAVGMVVVASLGLVQIAEVGQRQQAAEQQLAAATFGNDPCFGATALAKGPTECPVADDAPLILNPELASKDKPSAYADGCWNSPPFKSRKNCTYGEGKVQVALVGNSHAGQWLPALQVLAERHDWTITTYLASECNFTDAENDFDTKEKAEGCRALGRWAIDETGGSRYDLVVASQLTVLPKSAGAYSSRTAAAVAGFESYLDRWATNGTNIAILKDPPYPKRTVSSVPDCIAQNLENHDVCAGIRDDWLPTDAFVLAANRLQLDNVTSLNLDKYFCTEDFCRAVNGGVITYFDGSHLTATYAKTLVPYLEDSLVAQATGR